MCEENYKDSIHRYNIYTQEFHLDTVWDYFANFVQVLYTLEINIIRKGGLKQCNKSLDKLKSDVSQKKLKRHVRKDNYYHIYVIYNMSDYLEVSCNLEISSYFTVYMFIFKKPRNKDVQVTLKKQKFEIIIFIKVEAKGYI